MRTIIITALLGMGIISGCSSNDAVSTSYNDGEIPLPSDYKSWPVFVSGIEKSSGHIRDIYINNAGAETVAGKAFANGTKFVMEIYNAEKNGDGGIVKAALAKVFVMSKDQGNGQSATIKTGDWAYSAFDASGNALSVDYESCRGCHVPLVDTDYIFHYSKYFDTQAGSDY